jgi:hypothetical protein
LRPPWGLGHRVEKHGIRVDAIASRMIKTAMGARVPEISKQRASNSALGDDRATIVSRCD